MHCIDFDALFQEYLMQNMQAYKGEFTESEWEERIVELYQQFIQLPFEELAAILKKEIILPKEIDRQSTPKKYFQKKSAVELVDILKEYCKNDIVVPDMLLEELAKVGYSLEIANLLLEEDERLQLYAIDLLQADRRILQSYFYILKNSQYSVAVKTEIVERLAKIADKLKKPLYKLLGTDGQEYAIELLILSGERSDILYTTIINGYKNGKDKLLYLKYIGDYQDTRALELLYQEIASEEIGYILFKEIKYTIEKLGGSYDIIRNFNLDDDYKAIQLANAREEELREQGKTEVQKNG